MKSVGWENLSVLELLFLCGSEISVLLKGDICARLPCLQTSNSDWELAPDALPIIRQQKQWRRWWCLGGGGLLVEKVRQPRCQCQGRRGTKNLQGRLHRPITPLFCTQASNVSLPMLSSCDSACQYLCASQIQTNRSPSVQPAANKSQNTGS